MAEARRVGIVTFSGDIDFATREAFRKRLSEILDTEISIVDLSGATYIDSAGISQILWLYRDRRKSGKSPPRVVVGPRIARIFEVAGLHAAFPIFSSLREAQAE